MNLKIMNWLVPFVFFVLIHPMSADDKIAAEKKSPSAKKAEAMATDIRDYEQAIYFFGLELDPFSPDALLYQSLLSGRRPNAANQSLLAFKTQLIAEHGNKLLKLAYEAAHKFWEKKHGNNPEGLKVKILKGTQWPLDVKERALPPEWIKDPDKHFDEVAAKTQKVHRKMAFPGFISGPGNEPREEIVVVVDYTSSLPKPGGPITEKSEVFVLPLADAKPLTVIK